MKNGEDYPLKGTVEMVGAKPEDVSGNIEEPKSYQDIGQERLEKATEKVRDLASRAGNFMSNSWNKIKSFGSKTKEIGKSALMYALATPEMVSDTKDMAEEKVGEGINFMVKKAEEGLDFVGDKMGSGIEFVADKSKMAYESTKDMGKAVAGRALEEVVYVSDKAREKYEKTVDYGREKYASLQEKAKDAKLAFQTKIEEARQRKAERIAKSEKIQQEREYAKALQNLLEAKQRFQEVQSRLNMEGGIAA